jgi:isopentenyl diphosphate isomerase/L-lactate dehydrogenase-like FMN-dependent dehydrogenase
MFNDNVEDALNVHDLRIMAQKRLPKWLFEFVDRGTEDEVALRNNRAAFERIKLKTQVLVDVSNRNQAITLFGKNHDMPIGIAPTGPAGMLYYKGELELARAAKAANIPFTLATGSQTSMEEVAKVVGGTLWFQLYMWSDVRLSHGLVKARQNAGFGRLW